MVIHAEREETVEPAVADLLRRQHARRHRALSLQDQAARAQESGLEHARLSTILELRLGRDSKSVQEEREVSETWLSQARRLYDEAATLLTGAS